MAARGGRRGDGGLTLDLAAKLAAAGLVDADDAARATAARQRAQRERTPKKHAGPKRTTATTKKATRGAAALASAGKDERHAAIREWVARGRLDHATALGADAEPYHFTTDRGRLARLSLAPDIRAQVVDGRAGIVAFMSHHGLAHAVVPRDLACEIHELFPAWLRVLRDHPGAGTAGS